MDRLDLTQCFRKEKLIELCEENNTTIKNEVVSNIDDIIKALKIIKQKVKKNRRAVNEDWKKAAAPLRNIMNVITNAWYLENEE